MAAKRTVRAQHRTPDQSELIVRDWVRLYESQIHLAKTAAENVRGALTNDSALRPSVHLITFRVKEPSHLADKLKRKVKEGAVLKSNPSVQDLFREIQDLAGVRVLHLHTHQLESINSHLRRIFTDQSYTLAEAPTANCWDIEHSEYYESLGLKVSNRDSLYSSVHYVVRLNESTGICCEIQVRTLSDEVWGEVSHSINYPHGTKNKHCLEQLKVLARLTTSCSRLVDSIFNSNELGSESGAGRKAARKSSRRGPANRNR